MKTRIALLLILVTAIGCKQASTDEGKKAPGGGEQKTTPASNPVSGTAVGDGKEFNPTWGISMWNDKDDGKLVLGFLETEPSAEFLEKIQNNKSMFMGVSLEVPLIEIGIQFARDQDGAPDISKPGYYTVLYHNFGDRGPMTLNRSFEFEQGQIKISGSLAAGGNVKGRIEGVDKFELGDDRRDYKWSLNFDLPVEQ